MSASMTKTAANVALTAIYISTLVPIFIFGGAMLWGLDMLMMIGILLMLYSINGGLILIKVWVHPETTIIKAERILSAIMFLAIVGIIAQDIFDRDVRSYLTAGTVVVFAIKWFSLERLYKNRISPS
jgi:hypothetical protein